ncbi:MAG TPA: bifunctional YncE family protein/alkaline phosphatase family protein [Polyangiaceae bacterium]|nr:bifunctional YncE family protein/alkaline phosphatase family protein [Polyangiaceae bacterium]
MRSNLWILAAGSAAFLAACSATSTSNEPSEVQAKSTIATVSAPDSDATSSLEKPARGPQRTRLATGQYVTPTALRGSAQQFLNPGLTAYPNFIAGEAVRSQLSPDGKTLAVLCAGQNSLIKTDGSTDTTASTQFIFLYDVSGPNERAPKLTQVLTPSNAHVGLVFSPDGKQLYAAGGRDDLVRVYSNASGTWAASASIALNHANVGLGVGVAPNAGGLGLSKDGKTLVVVNNYNDSISVVDTANGTVRYEHDLRPYFADNEGSAAGVGGTFPFAVVVKDNGTAYVSSDRDREVVVIEIGATKGRLIKRIKLDGNALGLTLDASERRLYVAQDNADQVAVIDTRKNTVIAKIDVRAPEGLLPEDDEHDVKLWHENKSARYTGAGTFAVTLSPDGETLYAVNSGSNSIAVVRINQENRGNKHDRAADEYQVVGLIPTAYEPHDVTLSADGTWFYIVNGKSVTGPNPGHLSGSTGSLTEITYPGGNAAASTAAKASNQYQFQLERASLVAAPVPGRNELDALTAQVAENNFYKANPEAESALRALRSRIKHVIYVIKENRTFDQVLGDLDNGANVDSSITQFPRKITPSLHKLATQFVTLDNFKDPGDGSMDGWSWSLQGRVTDTETITQQINYAFVNRGLSYESEGTNRGVPVNFSSVAERDFVAGKTGTTNYSAATAALLGGTANLLTGTGNHASSDAPDDEQGGYIFRAVLQAGGTVRNYGMLTNNIGSIGTKAAPIIDPYTANEVQVRSLTPDLAPFTDVYFRGYDNNYPDLWRYLEWKREFDQFAAAGVLPNLSLIRFGHDHMGNFGTAFAGINTPETQQADNDLAVGLLVQAVAHSHFAEDTLIIVTEDDCQDGPDHVDSHRATTYVAGAYVKHGSVVSKHYSQVNVIRTIEDLLGTEHLNLNTAFQAPMTEIFDLHSRGKWAFAAEASTILQTTDAAGLIASLGVSYTDSELVKPQHDAQYWAKATDGFDFSEADQVPTAQFNRVLWKGLKGDKPYPEHKGAKADD